MSFARKSLFVFVVVLALSSAAAAKKSKAAEDDNPLALARPGAPMEDVIPQMSTKELRRFLKERQVECHGCVERGHLVSRALEVRHHKDSNQRVAEELTPFADSAYDTLSPHHIGSIPEGTRVVYPPKLDTMSAEKRLACTEMQGNGTVTCYDRATLMAHAATM